MKDNTIDTTQWNPEILPTKERMGKRDIDIVRSDRGGLSMRARNFSDPLMFYARSGLITLVQRRAGCKLQALFYMSGMRSQYVISRYCEVRGGEPVRLEEVQEEFRLAREAIRGKIRQKICFNVCCMGEKAGSRGKHGNTGNMNYLRDALDDLIKHFGYEEKITGSEGSI